MAEQKCYIRLSGNQNIILNFALKSKQIWFRKSAANLIYLVYCQQLGRDARRLKLWLKIRSVCPFYTGSRISKVHDKQKVLSNFVNINLRHTGIAESFCL
jgi:hypothetical protein